MASELARLPKILLLDEPLSGIDAEARAWLEQELRNYVSKGGTALIYSQEVMDLRAICDQIIDMDSYFDDTRIQELEGA